MVFAELSEQLISAIQKFQSATVVDDEVLQTCLKDIGVALLQADINIHYVSEIRNNIKASMSQPESKQGNPRKLIQKLIIDELTRLITSTKKPYNLEKNMKNVVMFVGLQGSGKTTTCTKYAYYYQRKGWKVALVCADTFRAGAFDQLKQNATKIGIPFYGSYTESDPVKISLEGVTRLKKEKFDLIIIDTSGRHKQEASLLDEMKQIEQAVKPDDIIFVMDSHIGQACYDQAKAFHQAVSVGSVIVTKLDGHAKGGGALSAVAATNSPITFIGIGEHFDEFEPFNPQSFVSRLLGLGDLKGLVSTVAEALPLDKQPDLMSHLSQGVFSLRDMRTQLEAVLKMGSMSQIMSMMPGFMQQIMPKGNEKQGVEHIKKFLVVMDSMTNEELDDTKPLSEGRIIRVSLGSGQQVFFVKKMMEQYRTFSKMFGKLGKAGLSKKGGPMQMEQMMRNPQQAMQNMMKMMDPKMLKQLGGSQNWMSMFKEFGKLENMPDMQELMQNFGGGSNLMNEGRHGRHR